MNRPVRRPRSAVTPRAGVGRVLCIAVLMVAAIGATALFPAPTPAAVGPVAQAFSPPAGAINISPLLPIWVKFTTPIDATTLTADTFYLTPLGDSTKVPATLTYIAVQKRATLTPTTPLTNGVTYRATLVSPVDGEELDLGPVVADENGEREMPLGSGNPRRRMMPIWQDRVLVLDAR